MNCEVESTKISDWVSIAIALLAFGAAVWQANEARKQAAITRGHNKMSVMPILVHHVGWHNEAAGLTVTFKLKNVGVGVALVTDRYFTFEGKRFIPQRASNMVEELLELIFKRALNYQLITSDFFGPSARIPPGAEFTIAKILFPNSHIHLRAVIEAMINKASFVVVYESVYKEAFIFSTDD